MSDADRLRDGLRDLARIPAGALAGTLFLARAALASATWAGLLALGTVDVVADTARAAGRVAARGVCVVALASVAAVGLMTWCVVRGCCCPYPGAGV